MAGVLEESCVGGLMPHAVPQDENALRLYHIGLVAPELIEAVKGGLVTNQGELVTCLKAHQPYYPLWLSDLVDFFYQEIPDSRLSGTTNLSEDPALIEGIYIFNVIKLINPDIIRAKEIIDSFVESERHKLGIDSGSTLAKIPEGYELCYYLIILNRDQHSITFASAARPIIP
jgi:hypothetical protein